MLFQSLDHSTTGIGNPLQDSLLENPKARGAWWATVQSGHRESDKTEQLSTYACRYLKVNFQGA